LRAEPAGGDADDGLVDVGRELHRDLEDPDEPEDHDEDHRDRDGDGLTD
jgi:hypothetical protein